MSVALRDCCFGDMHITRQLLNYLVTLHGRPNTHRLCTCAPDCNTLQRQSTQQLKDKEQQLDREIAETQLAEKVKRRKQQDKQPAKLMHDGTVHQLEPQVRSSTTRISPNSQEFAASEWVRVIQHGSGATTKLALTQLVQRRPTEQTPKSEWLAEMDSFLEEVHQELGTKKAWFEKIAINCLPTAWQCAWTYSGLCLAMVMMLAVGVQMFIHQSSLRSGVRVYAKSGKDGLAKSCMHI